MSTKVRKFVSIDFGQESLKIAYLRSFSAGLEVLNLDTAEISLSKGGASGLISFISNFLKSSSASSKDAYVTVSDPDNIILKHIILPAVPKDEISEAIKWQVKTELPFNPEEAIIDWQLIKEFSEEDGAKKIELICLLAKQAFIKEYLGVLTACGLSALRVSCGYFNYANILSLLPDQAASVAVLDIGHKSAVLSVFKGNKLHFTRNLVVSADRLIRSLVGTLTSDKGATEITYEKAKELISEFGIPREGNALLKDDIRGVQIISLIRPVFENLVLELKRSFSYLSSTLREEAPSALYITGGGAGLKNLDWYLEDELKIKVQHLPIPEFIKTGRLGSKALAGREDSIINLLGAAISGGPGDINLLPEEAKTQKIEFLESASLRVIGITLTAVLLFLFFIFKFQETNYTKRLKTAKSHLDSISEIKALKSKINDRVMLIDKARKRRVLAYEVLAEVGNIIAPSMILNELSLDLGEQGSLSLKGVIMSKGAAAEVALTEFMKDAEAAPIFKEAALLESRNVSGAQAFIIKCDLSD